MSDTRTEHFISRLEIHDVLCRYCRGLDRMDKALAYSVWHADGTAHYHDMYTGSGRGFVDWVWDAHAAMERHSHQLGNSLVNLDGDSASSETYVTVVLWTRPDDQGRQQEITARGRYLDAWSRRDGRWAIDHREHILDMQTVAELRAGQVSVVSARDRTDPSYQLFPGPVVS
ncbi:nuclear transport factor 2 family protein [Pseudohalioglobus sediminis]|uniref:Nuclear transport factor 2 family protein n=1 Tax=Pseudohalioglobus sediminis TaxID=2606449 RepID=A0A5B0X703_9GAMM|nr:nuclear transport factor 2 family protein [Pseudohalioglobus sediminis]KAA1194368.1 nuclear transport factor 2 family protein [Pseudohalioglobus sediminis]